MPVSRRRWTYDCSQRTLLRDVANAPEHVLNRTTELHWKSLCHSDCPADTMRKAS